ncbi:MAG: hypothetical protein V1770_05135 [bacterium]
MPNQIQNKNSKKYDLDERTAKFGEDIIDFLPRRSLRKGLRRARGNAAVLCACLRPPARTGLPVRRTQTGRQERLRRGCGLRYSLRYVPKA